MPIPHPSLQTFIERFTRLIDQAPADEPRIVAEGGALLQGLVATDDWLADEHAQPHSEHYQQYLLHCDPENRFSVVSFVWGPGQRTPVHDHTVWGLIGMLRGAERCERFAPCQAGESPRVTEAALLEQGEVDAVSPTLGDVHRVSNAFDDRVSISIHVYGADIGRVQRHVFDALSGTPKNFISGYANRDRLAA